MSSGRKSREKALLSAGSNLATLPSHTSLPGEYYPGVARPPCCWQRSSQELAPGVHARAPPPPQTAQLLGGTALCPAAAPPPPAWPRAPPPNLLAGRASRLPLHSSLPRTDRRVVSHPTNPRRYAPTAPVSAQPSPPPLAASLTRPPLPAPVTTSEGCRATDVAHALWAPFLRRGDLCVDATCGNGHDALFCARTVLAPADDATVGRGGGVVALDLSPAAVQATQLRLREALPPAAWARCQARPALPRPSAPCMPSSWWRWTGVRRLTAELGSVSRDRSLARWLVRWRSCTGPYHMSQQAGRARPSRVCAAGVLQPRLPARR